MRHITDGELHAYLDGALDHLAAERGEEVRRHLEACTTCRERLQDEEGIRKEAQGILDASAPMEIPLPSFEELRARAEASERKPEDQEAAAPRRRAPLRGLPLAWAATVVLALGVGWMGGQVWMSAPRSDLVPSGSLNSTLRSSSPLDPSVGSEAGVPFQAEQESQADSPAGASPGALDESTVGGLQVPDAAERMEGQATPSSAGAAARDADASRGAAELLAARQKSTLETIPADEARRDALAPEAAVLTPPEPTAEQAGVPTILLRGRSAMEEGSMLVPGLEVVNVDWEEWVPGERALHIRQLLPTGDTLELRYLGLLMGSDPEAVSVSVAEGRVPEEEGVERPLSPKVLEASLPPGWNQVVMRWGRGWLVARAPLPVESLRGILRSIR